MQNLSIRIRYAQKIKFRTPTHTKILTNINLLLYIYMFKYVCTYVRKYQYLNLVCVGLHLIEKKYHVSFVQLAPFEVKFETEYRTKLCKIQINVNLEIRMITIFFNFLKYGTIIIVLSTQNMNISLNHVFLLLIFFLLR